MGMFDYLRCDFPLPDPGDQGIRFQTKDLECSCSEYILTAGGRLVIRRTEYDGADDSDHWFKVEDVRYHGPLRFYAEHPKTKAWIEYEALFQYGQCMEIERVFTGTIKQRWEVHRIGLLPMDRPKEGEG